MKGKFGLSELIQTGILFTLLAIAYNMGQIVQKFDMRLERLEQEVFPGKS